MKQKTESFNSYKNLRREQSNMIHIMFTQTFDWLQLILTKDIKVGITKYFNKSLLKWEINYVYL